MVVRPPTPPVPGSWTPERPATTESRRVRSSKSARSFSSDSSFALRVFVRPRRSWFSAARVETSRFFRTDWIQRTPKTTPRTSESETAVATLQRSRDVTWNWRNLARACGTTMIVCCFRVNGLSGRSGAGNPRGCDQPHGSLTARGLPSRERFPARKHKCQQYLVSVQGRCEETVERYRRASATWDGPVTVAPSRSAMVRATRTTRWWAPRRKGEPVHRPGQQGRGLRVRGTPSPGAGPERARRSSGGRHPSGTPAAPAPGGPSP